MNNSTIKKYIIMITISLVVISTWTTAVYGTNHKINPLNNDQGSWEININIQNNEQTPYQGRIRLFLIEPISSINNVRGDPFHFSAKDILINEEIMVENTKDINLILTEDEADTIQEDNNMLLVAIYNEEGHDQYAYPPDGNRFTAHDVDAVAGAYPNQIGTNEKTDDFSHTVLIEEVATITCPNCPLMEETLYDIYTSDDYPFYFISLIWGHNQKVNNRVASEFNVYAVPLAIFDGGYSVFLGGSTNEYTYRQLIEECGERDVHDLDLTLSFFWNPELVFPPFVRIDEPANGIYFFDDLIREFDRPLVIGPFSIEATAYDNESGIDHVDFYINDELRSTDTFKPYRMNNWREQKLIGEYTIRVIAYDEFGYQNSDEINVIKIL
jgi:hypothetical protein